MRLIPTEFAKKKARNEAARIYADLKWKIKIKNLSAPDLLRLIQDAITETKAKVRVAEIADEVIKRYEAMIKQVETVTATKSPEGLRLLELN